MGGVVLPRQTMLKSSKNDLENTTEEQMVCKMKVTSEKKVAESSGIPYQSVQLELYTKLSVYNTIIY